MTEFFSAVATLLLVMDPLGNVPAFLACLKDVEESRRVRVVARENLFALLILLFFLFCGPTLISLLHIGRESLHIAGGVLLFLISLGMIFPGHWHMVASAERGEDAEPFIVPLATPLLAGPSTIATVMIFASRRPDQIIADGHCHDRGLARYGHNPDVLARPEPHARTTRVGGVRAIDGHGPYGHRRADVPRRTENLH